jgi:hypothetical protein
MPRHLTSDDLAIQDEGVATSEEEVWRFEGAGVSAADDAGNNQTLVTVAGGTGGAAGYEQQFFYNASYEISDVSPLVGLDFGVLTEETAGAAFLDPATDASTATFVFAETGLYQVMAVLSKVDGLLVFDPIHQRISLETGFDTLVGTGQTRYAAIEPCFSNSFGQVTWRCLMDFTEVFSAGDELSFGVRVGYGYVATDFEAYINFAKLV